MRIGRSERDITAVAQQEIFPQIKKIVASATDQKKKIRSCRSATLKSIVGLLREERVFVGSGNTHLSLSKRYRHRERKNSQLAPQIKTAFAQQEISPQITRFSAIATDQNKIHGDLQLERT